MARATALIYFRRTLLLLGAVLSLAGETRRALVVGNGDYKNVPPATQSAADARAFGRALTASQFQVDLLINVEADALAREINKFLQDLQPGDAAVFYFAGYAVQDMGENYLLPVGYAPAGTDGIEFQSYSVKRLVRYLETKKLSTGVVVLDYAPSNPAIERKFPEPGLATMDIRTANLVLALPNLPGRGTLPAPGRELSRYTEAWVAAAAEKGMSLDNALRRVKQQVSQSTGGEQVPAEISTLVNEFAFQPRSLAAVEWDRIANSRDIAAFEAFRERFPNDPLVTEAGNRVRTLEWDRVRADGDPKAVRLFLSRYPRHVEAARWLAAQEANEKNSTSSAVLGAIERYSKAYESRDVDSLQAVRPGLGPAERKRLEQAFREFKSIKYSLTPAGEPAIEATAATVKCRLKVEMRSSDGATPRPVDQAVTVKLRRQSDAWIIDTIQ
ncbi:MAG: caspase family protein [Acidobacteria bacterium]|nr:caspase family protein [Acidobacteriota bacterium]